MKNLKIRDNLGDLDINGRIILKFILKRGCNGVGWLYLTQDRVQWQVLVKIVMKLQVP
jgi:hypothetical protein